MWTLLCIGIAALGVGPRSYDRLDLNELVLRADLCVAGTIERVDGATIEVEISDIGFGEPRGATVTVYRFRDWTCAKGLSCQAAGKISRIGMCFVKSR